MQSVTIGTNQAGQRLDKFLHKYMPEAGTGFLYKMLRKKNITLNGKKAEGSEILSAGDNLSFFFSEETFQKFTGGITSDGTISREASAKRSSSLKEYESAYRTLKGISIIYEDENVLIADKPAGILSQKAEATDLTLNEWLIGYLLQKDSSLAEELHTFKPSVCNRLDRNTSGLVLCGKSLAGSQYLSKCIKERTIGKFYRTVCVGEITQSAKIKGYLEKDKTRNKVTVREEGSNYIETGYTPLSGNRGYTLLEVELITGKPHQIRAHLASMGHPLIGDYKYGNERENEDMKKKFGLQHQLLHAYRVTFPACGEGVGATLSNQSFIAPYPADFQQILSGLQLY